MTFVANSFAVALASAAIAWTGLSFLAPAHAAPGETFKASFQYKPADSAPVTYAGLKTQARKACMTEARELEFGPIATRVRWMERCEADLIGKAVDAIGKSELTALHEKNRASGQVAAR